MTVALIASGAALLGALIGSGTSVVISHSQERAEAERAADDGLREERRRAYTALVVAESSLGAAEENLHYCLGLDPGIPLPYTFDGGREVTRSDVRRSFRRMRTPVYRAYRTFEQSTAATTLIASTEARRAIIALKNQHVVTYQLLTSLPPRMLARDSEDVATGLDESRHDLDDLPDLRARFVSALRRDIGAAESGFDDVAPDPIDRYSGCGRR